MIEFKSGLSDRYKMIASYTVPFVERLFRDKKTVNLHGYNIDISKSNWNSHASRRHLIKESKKCAMCGIEGNIFVLERRKIDQPAFTLYHKTEAGEFIPMTADHIVPKALGGNWYHSNIQTLCTKCNNKKQDLLIFDFLTEDLISKFHVEIAGTTTLDTFISSHNINVTYN